MAVPSQFDNEFGVIARENINEFVRKTARALSDQSGKLLEIGPQERSLVRESFTNFAYESFDVVSTYGPTHVGDITRYNPSIADNTYDCVICMEVLEHTIDPFGAVRELRRILKDGGYLVVSAPLNWRIHGPIPDCWRFTEHGFRVLLRDFDILEFDILETPGRPLFPVHYNVLVRTDKSKNTPDSELRFRFID
ncbi:MAG: class I SAM-dependent methyltransferase [Planctomyces sp.]